jgi:Cytochrome c
MRIPLIIRIGALVVATTGFYAYVGQMVPQREVQPPQEIVIRADLTTADMVKVGREIMDSKGLCFTCHTIGKTGALRFPDLEGVDVRAQSRVAGLSDVEYFAQSMYEPDAYIVQGFNPGMPAINKPPIGLTDQEILCVIAYLQSLGGTPDVTLQTTHRYRAAPAAPGGAPAPAAAPAPGAAPPGAAPPPAAAPAPGAAPGGAQPPAAPAKGAQLRPSVSTPDVMTIASAGDPGVLRSLVGVVAILRPVVAHQPPARFEGDVAR